MIVKKVLGEWKGQVHLISKTIKYSTNRIAGFCIACGDTNKMFTRPETRKGEETKKPLGVCGNDVFMTC
jgi:hypothetical protein